MSRIIALLAAVALAPACRSHVPAGVLVGSGDESGRFVAHYGPASPVFRDFRSGLIANRFLDTIAIRLNDSLRIPRDIVLQTEHCGDPNAKYDSDRRRVTLCYELFKSLADRFDAESGGEYLVTGTVMFAPFGTSLHVSGRDSARLETAIKPYRADKKLKWERSDPSLEDVFIDLMNKSRDNFQ